MLQKKIEGGMGFRFFGSTNKAMLMKQLWRLIKYPDLYVSKVLKRKYMRSDSILSFISNPSDSTVWKSMCVVKEFFRMGIISNVGGDGIRWKGNSSGIYSVKRVMNLHITGNYPRKEEGGNPRIWMKEPESGQGYGGYVFLPKSN